MTNDTLLSDLENYKADEQFYRTYQEKKAFLTVNRFQEFLDSLDPKQLSAHEYYLPEFMPKTPSVRLLNPPSPEQAAGSDFFTENATRMVRVKKHPRYMPPIPHSHDYFEVIYVLSGNCIHRVDTQTKQLFSGDLCLLSPSVCHSLYAEDDGIVLTLLISPALLEQILPGSDSKSDPISDFLRNAIFMKKRGTQLVLPDDSDRLLRAHMLDMYAEEVHADTYSDRILCSMVSVLFLRLMRKYHDTTQNLDFSFPTDSEATRIIRYLEEHYADSSLAQLAQLLNYSVPYCSNYVKKHLGQSFLELQKRIRLQKAANYLQNSNMPISQISEHVGYSSPENFMRIFKKEYGLTPTQFRQKSPEGLQK